MHRHTGSSTESPLCPCLACYGARGGRIIAAADDQIATLRADLTSSQREVERLRKIFDDAGQGEHNVLALVDHYQDEAIKATAEVERCRSIITSMVAAHGDPRIDGFIMHGASNADALRYLASIGRVEIVSEQGRRVVARWKP